MLGRTHLLELLSAPGDEGGGAGEVFASAQWPKEAVDVDQAVLVGRPTVRRRTVVATSWLVPEEEKQEPGWPVALMKYYRRMINKEEDDRLEAAMWKLAAERKASRAQERGQVADAEAKANRAKDKALDEKFKPTLQEQIATERERLNLAVSKEGIVLRELDETKQHLAADALRDAEREEQVQSLKREADYIQGLKDAERENELRMEYRNMTPGEPAINGQGKVITRKVLCEAERNTVFRNGKCIVGGEEDGPDTAEEIGATTQVNDSEDALEEASAVVKAKDRAASAAAEAADAAKQHFEVLKQKLSSVKNPSEAKQQEVKDAEAEFAKLQRQQQAAQAGLNAAKAAKEKAKKKHHEALEALLKVQDDEEHHDEGDIERSEKMQKDSLDKIHQDEDNMAAIEEDDAKLVGHHAQDLSDEANRHEGFEREHLGAEAGSYKIWSRDAETEAKALRNRDNEEVVRLHGVQREDALSTGERHREVLNDAAVHGGGPEVLKPTSLTKEEEEELSHDNGRLDGLLKDEKHSEEKVYDALSSKSTTQEHKNMVGLRRASTMDALRHEAHSGVESVALCAGAAWLPHGRQRRSGRRSPPFGSRKAAAVLSRFL